jgi:hypothetical protein
VNLLSCSNCWFNGLQYGPLGLSAGYCAEHRVVLRQADWTTCPRHMRKDLAFDSAVKANRAHRLAYRADRVQFVLPGGGSPTEFTSPEPSALRADPVGDAVADFGELDSKIESLAQLNRIPGARAEIAILSLGRGYVRRCVERKGHWTSGLHLLVWTRKRMTSVPAVSIADFRLQTAAPMDRQAELAQWSIMMLRLCFISDVARHARSDDVSRLAHLQEEAAEATVVPSVKRLMKWARSRGVAAFDRALPQKRYVALARDLHRD